MYDYKLINLNHILSHTPSDVKSFLRFNGVKKFDECDVESLIRITTNIDEHCRFGYNVSYYIDRLDKEFDLIRIGNNNVINIELKLSNKDISQCYENYKYFKQYYNDCDIYIFCYESDKNKIYLYDIQNNDLKEVSFDFLNEKLKKIEDPVLAYINFSISSIYEDPTFFFEKRYNLTSSQKITKSKVLDLINKSDNKIIIISGRAGTGKSLLALDLMNDMLILYDEIFYLCPFKLNQIVDQKLREKYNMKTVDFFKRANLKAKHVIIDEAQRVSYGDIENLKKNVSGKIILFGDINQNIDSESCFEKLYLDRDNNDLLNMNCVIRTDDTFDIFAKKILGISTKGVKSKRIDPSKIQITMISANTLNNLKDYVYIEPAKSKIYYDCRNQCNRKLCLYFDGKCLNSKVPYDVISREYKNVVLFLCDAYVIKDGVLSSKMNVCYGNLQKQIYSIITRTTESLKIVTSDITIYNFLMQILENMHISNNKI